MTPALPPRGFEPAVKTPASGQTPLKYSDGAVWLVRVKIGFPVTGSAWVMLGRGPPPPANPPRNGDGSQMTGGQNGAIQTPIVLLVLLFLCFLVDLG